MLNVPQIIKIDITTLFIGIILVCLLLTFNMFNILTNFRSMFPRYIPLKHADVFREYRKETAWIGLIFCINPQLKFTCSKSTMKH